MNLKKLFGRAKRTIAANSSRSTTISTISSTQCSPPILACSNKNIPLIQMQKLRQKTSNVSSTASTTLEHNREVRKRRLAQLVESRPQDREGRRQSLDSKTMAETSLFEVNVSPASSNSDSKKVAGDDSAVDEKQQEEAVLKAWGKNQELKKLAIPTDYPDYMREPPKLAYSETETSQLRRKYISKKIDSYTHQPLKRNVKLLQQGPRPKLNRTSSLRKSYIERQPIMSQHFQSHYSLYSRPPFRHINVKSG